MTLHSRESTYIEYRVRAWADPECATEVWSWGCTDAADAKKTLQKLAGNAGLGRVWIERRVVTPWDVVGDVDLPAFGQQRPHTEDES